MSIGDAVNAHCEAGTLHILPAGPFGRKRRTLCVSSVIKEQLDRAQTDEPDRSLWAKARYRLSEFVWGDVIRVRLRRKARKNDNAHMVRLHPPDEEVWEYRYLEKSLGVRFFGRFADQDFFVALLWQYRGAFEDEDDPLWKEYARSCIAEWERLFPGIPPFSAEEFPDGYILDAFPV